MDFWALLFLSLTVALSGALSPGPLLTYTINNSIALGRRGWSVGFLVIGGHAALEGGILTALLLGMAILLASPMTTFIIGIAGGAVLILFGALYIRDSITGKISLSINTSPTRPIGETGEGDAITENEVPAAKPPALWRVVAGGAVVSASNPYWWLWWATIGFNLLVANLAFVGTAGGVTAFFVGHELGDLLWYVIVSLLVFAGQQKINQNIYRGIIFACGDFMAALGIWFIVGVLL
ncbi:MAG TPA: LysE family transporter [Candidatus Lokiarchaeia archaeon]|nr:LysE family transporter [Candidatus Lokiarchaeia archaeon]